MKNFKNIEGILVLFLFVLLWVYLWLRAIYVPLVHDELVTYHVYMISGKWLPFEGFVDANNHLLNSALGSFLYNIFGYNGYLIPRIPNLLVFPLYFWAVYQIGKRYFNNKTLLISFILAITCPPYFLEFFALARGYGMAISFFVLTILFYAKGINKFNFKNDLLFTLFASLSILSNLTLLFGVLGLYCLKILGLIKSKKIKFSQFLTLIVGLSLFGYMVLYSMELQKMGVFYYGSKEGFISLTINSLVKELFFIDNYIVDIVICSLGTIVLGVFIYKYLLEKNLFEILNKLFIFPFLLAFCVLLIVFSKILIGVNFPEDRAALYLFPLFISSLFISLKFLNVKARKGMSIVIASFFVISLIFHINISHSIYWHKDFISPKLLERFSLENSNNNMETISGIGLLKTVWAQSVLNKKEPLNLLESYKTIELDTISDYQLTSLKRFPQIKTHYNELLYDEISELSLVKRKQKLSRKFLAEKSFKIGKTNDEFISLWSNIPDSLIGKVVLFEIEAQFKNYQFPSELLLVVSDQNSNDDMEYYEKFDLDFLLMLEEKLHLLAYVPTVHSSNSGIYLWNPEKTILEIENLKVNFFELYP